MILQSEVKEFFLVQNVKQASAESDCKVEHHFWKFRLVRYLLQLKNSISDSKLQWFQYRILCGILTTNNYLYTGKVTDSDRYMFY